MEWRHLLLTPVTSQQCNWHLVHYSDTRTLLDVKVRGQAHYRRRLGCRCISTDWPEISPRGLQARPVHIDSAPILGPALWVYTPNGSGSAGL